MRLDAPDVQVCLDPLRTRQAVLNLVDNALRHGRGTVTVIATATRSCLTIDVRDQGEGFPSDLVDRAFEPFVRGAGAADPPGPKGAGLGLAIVQAVAAAHGGGA